MAILAKSTNCQDVTDKRNEIDKIDQNRSDSYDDIEQKDN